MWLEWGKLGDNPDLSFLSPPVSCESLPLTEPNVTPSVWVKEPVDGVHSSQLPRARAGQGGGVLVKEKRLWPVLLGG